MSLLQWYRSRQAGRVAGLLLTLLVEGLLLLVVLAFGTSIARRDPPRDAITVVDVKAAARRNPDPSPEKKQQPAPKRAEAAPPKTVEPAEAPPQPVEPKQEPPAPQLIRLSPTQMAASDIAAIPKQAEVTAPKRSRMGPPDTGMASRDTARVGGSGPNGEPLYAAAWYREPYDDELRGYLSTATGPGWGLIACRTAPDYRVEDCVKIDEYPTGSNIARAVLAAAWQFRVRPPRLGGQPRIGEWVRIRIDYDYKRK